EVKTHRAFGVVQCAILPDDADPRDVHWPRSATVAQLLATSVNLSGELPEPMNFFAAMELLNKQDRFEATEVDQQIAALHGTQFNSQFLIDADCVIRWSYIEGQHSVNDLGNFPGEAEM